jgi:hypothetical protein
VFQNFLKERYYVFLELKNKTQTFLSVPELESRTFLFLPKTLKQNETFLSAPKIFLRKTELFECLKNLKTKNLLLMDKNFLDLKENVVV